MPKGSAFKKGSLSVVTDEGTLKESQFSYELKADYNQSGRTLLVVKVKPQAKYYNVYYHTQHAWDSIKDYGKDIKNPVAYETGNNSIAKGYPDNGGNLSDDNKGLMSGLDQNSTGNKFLYSEDSHWINALTAAISGLDKKVMTAEDSGWSYETFTKPEGEYQYRWRFANNFTSDSKNMIFFDSLENYVVKSGEKSDWHGTLQRIDTSQLESKGINPVVYISEVENLNLDQHHDLTNKTIWKRVDASTDLSKAKAVSIDMRKKADGTDFIMKSGESVNAVLYMKAPATVQEDLHRYPVTYNNIYIQDTVIDQDGGEFDYFIHQDYTKVKYRITGNFSLDKVSSENADEKIEGIKFRLFGTSDFGTEVNEIKETDQNGHIDFKGIEKGSYTLQEYGGLIDWQEDHTEHKVVVHGDRTVTIDDQLGTITITNKPRVHTDVELIKTDLTKKTKKLKGAKFKLWGTSDYGNEILKYATSQDDGSVKFENVELGTYKLEELEAPEGYVRERDTYTVVVDKSVNFSISNYTKIGEEKEVTKHSSTSNISEDGTQNGNYANSLAKTDVVTIPGAKSLKVKIIYGGESASYDWVCAWEGNHADYTAKSNYSSSFTGKLGGGNHVNASNTKEYTVNGDTVTFAFRSDSSGCGDGYGYWAEVSGIASTVQESGGPLDLDKRGNSLFYNEPLHSLRLVKKSSYDGNTIAGAEFTLTGTSNYGTKVNLKATSETNGFLDFKGLEAGTYTLQEVKSPDGFRLDDTKRVVTITKEGEIIISGLTQNKYGNFDVTNQKIPEGQVTVIKKWKDKKKPEERTMPIIKISGKKPEVKYWGKATIDHDKWDNAKYEVGLARNQHPMSLDEDNSMTSNDNLGPSLMKETVYYTKKTFCEAFPDAIKVDDGTTERSIYLYRNGDNFYWWSDAEHVYFPKDCSSLFAECVVSSLEIDSFKTTKTVKMMGMFNDCPYLMSLNLSNFDTSNVYLMSGMFANCSRLTSLNVSKFNTGGVINMEAMFANCSSLTSLDLSNFNTNNVINMEGMFANCSSLTQLNLSNFSTSEVTNMSSMFENCSSLTSLDLSTFNTSNVLDMHEMFFNCSKLSILDLNNFNVEHVYDMGAMFAECHNITTLEISSWKTSSLRNIRQSVYVDEDWKDFGMFQNCWHLTSLDLHNFNTSEIYSMFCMFYNCSRLTSLNVSNFDTSNVIDMGSMFCECSSLKSLDISNFNTSNVTEMGDMFCNCSSLTSLDLSNFDTSNVTSLWGIVSGCENLTQLDLSNFDTSNTIKMNFMFSNCKKLTSLDLSNFDTSNVTSMQDMFGQCSSLRSIDISSLDTSNVTDMWSMFWGCSDLTSLDVSNFDTSKVTTMFAMFRGCSSLTTLDLSNFDTSNVTEMDDMFCYCSSLTSLDLSNFDTSKVTEMDYMFEDCSNLTAIYISNKFDTSKVTSSDGMFSNCTNLHNFDSSKTDITKAHYGEGGYLTYKASTTASLQKEQTPKASTTASRLKKGLKQTFTAFAQSMRPLQVEAAETPLAQGTSGTCTWTISAEGELVIKPTNGTEGTLDSIGDYDDSPWYSNSSDIKTVRFEGTVYGGSSCNYMFYSCSEVTSINFTGFNSSNVTDMSGMFMSCSNLTSLNFASIDTSKVTNMYAMFNLCISLTSLNLRSFNTKNVENMEYMFSGCYALTYLNISSFNTSNVTSMKQMFFGCLELASINVIYFNTSNVTDMSFMFTDCQGLSSLNLKYFNTSSVTTMKAMFKGCSSLEDVYLNNFDTSKVEDMSLMFSDCQALTSLDLTNFNTVQVTDLSAMFQSCESLTSLDLNSFNTSKVESMSFLVGSCSKLTNVNLDSFDTSNVKDMSNMFYKCSALTELNLSNFNTSQVTDMCSMFEDCESITILNLSSFDTSNVTKMCDNFSGMFRNCESLIALDLSNFNTSKVTNMHEMFSGCFALTQLDLSSFNTSKVTSMYSMFSRCCGLTQLDLSNFNTSEVTNMKYMFDDCLNLATLDLSSFDTNKVTNTGDMFSGCSDLSTLKLDKNFKSLQGTGLPTPSPTGTEDEEYTGKWTKGTPYNHADAISTSDLMDTFSGAIMADTWYWEKNGQDPRLKQTYTSISDRVFIPADFTPTDDMTQEQKEALAAARDTL